jgi:hypothetical protein
MRVPCARLGPAPFAALLALAVGLFVLSLAPKAEAYPWMIRHGYTGCTPCHTDPSGGAGVLTTYGREQSDLLLRTRYGDSSEDASPTAGFLWGLIHTADGLRLGGDFREAYVSTKPDDAPASQSFITMRADFLADMKIDHVRAAGSLGYAPQGALAASLTPNTSDNIVSREHWVGYEFGEDGAFLVRAGRMAVPFGIRDIEHNLWARTLTRSDFNDTQEYGAAFAFSADRFRGEVMGIAGNFELHPDAYRERGYSAYAEYAPNNTLALGLSSQFTRATRDIVYNVTDYRQAHGVMARYSPITELAFLAEADWVYQSLTYNGHRGGYATFVQADVEPAQGVHFMVTGEAMNGGSAGEPSSFDGWLSGVWFFAPHLDIRFDGIYQTLGSPTGYTNVFTWLGQIHAWL